MSEAGGGAAASKAQDESSTLDPKAIPFFSPLKANPQGSNLDPTAKEYVDPASELVKFEKMKSASRGEATDAEIQAEGDLFVTKNALVECEQEADPDAADGLDEATAMVDRYGGEALLSPTDSEIDAAGNLFVLETEISKLEVEVADEAAEDDEASNALEQMDADLHLKELHAEEALAEAVIALGENEQSEANKRLQEFGDIRRNKSGGEFAREGEMFVLRNEIEEVEQQVDPESDPRVGLDEASAMLAEAEVQREISLEARKFEMENAVLETEQQVDPESDPRVGLDEASAMLAEADIQREISLEARKFEMENAEADVIADLATSP